MKKLLLGITILTGFELSGMNEVTVVERENSTTLNLAPMHIQERAEVAQNSIRPDQCLDGLNPHSPIYETRDVPYQVWVPFGYSERISWFGGSRWVDTSHWETRYMTEHVVVGYRPLTAEEAVI